MKTYDLAIVGAGSAGVWAAPFAARLGVRVALLEKERIGGDCTHFGCVPSKALLKAAQVARHMRHADEFGFDPVQPSRPATGHGRRPQGDRARICLRDAAGSCRCGC